MSRNKDLNPRNGDFDLTELMNKFLAEYDSGNGNEYEPHKEEVSFDAEPQYNPEHHPYHHQQQHHQQQQYYEDHHQQQQQQFYQDQPQQPIYQGYPKEPQRNQVYNRYKDESNKVNNGANQDEQKSVAQSSNSAKPNQQQPSAPAKEQTVDSQEEEVDPKLRDFTLIISKLLFQLSQL